MTKETAHLMEAKTMTNLEILKQLSECIELADEMTEETGYLTGLGDLLTECMICLAENLGIE